MFVPLILEEARDHTSKRIDDRFVEGLVSQTRERISEKSCEQIVDTPGPRQMLW